MMMKIRCLNYFYKVKFAAGKIRNVCMKTCPKRKIKNTPVPASPHNNFISGCEARPQIPAPK